MDDPSGLWHVNGKPWPVRDPELRDEWAALWDRLNASSEGTVVVTVGLMEALYNEVVLACSDRDRAVTAKMNALAAVVAERQIGLAEASRARAALGGAGSMLSGLTEMKATLDSLLASCGRVEYRAEAAYTNSLSR